jgi:hemoglobin/transferrin/lactoferrin receptor protein
VPLPACRTIRLRWLAALVVLTTAAPLAAEDEYGASAAVTRERFEQARSVSTVSREVAEASGADNVGDMLERAPAVVVQRTASGSATPIVRGLTGYQVLLMLDDLRLNDSLTRSGGSATLNLVDPESVQRIEVVRGPASVLYGSDALGGVVHVRTLSTGASAEGKPLFGATAALRAASAERALRGSGALSGGGRGFGLRISGTRGHAGALRRGEDLGLQPYTGHGDWAASGKAELFASHAHKLSLSHQSGHLFDMPRSDVSEPQDVQRTISLDRDGSVLTYAGRLLDGRLRLYGYLGVSLRREHRDRVRPGRVQNERERVRSVQAGLRASASVWRGANLELGFETVTDRIESSATNREDGELTRERGRYVDGSKYDMHALYALLSQQLTDRLMLLVGARGTMVFARAPIDPLFAEALGDDARLDRRFARPVASAGVRAALSPEVALTLSVLGGFRAPNLEDFQAFGGGARGYTVPNLRLREERSWTFESGIEQSSEHWSVQAYLFASLLSGLVTRVPTTLDGMSIIDGEPVIGRANASDSLLLGGEASVTHRLDIGLFASVAAFATWGRSERPNDAGQTVVEPASKVPPPIVGVRAGYDKPQQPYFADLSLALQLSQQRLSEADRADVRLCPNGPEGCSEVPGYADLSLRAGVRVNPRLLVVLAAENLLDRAYRSYASGAYAPGRNVIASFRTRW